MLVTVNGDVPVATLEIKVLAVTEPEACKFVPVMFAPLVIASPAVIVLLALNIVVDRLPVAALNAKFAFAPSATFPDVAFANNG